MSRHRTGRTAAALCVFISLTIVRGGDYGVHAERVSVALREWLPGETRVLTSETRADESAMDNSLDEVDLHSQFMVLWAIGDDKDQLSWEVCARSTTGHEAEAECYEDAASYIEGGTANSSIFGYDLGCVPYTAKDYPGFPTNTDCPEFEVRVTNTSPSKIEAGVKSVVGMILSSTRNKAAGRIGGAWAARLRSVYKHIYAIPIPPEVAVNVWIKGKVLPDEGLTSMVTSPGEPLDYDEVQHTEQQFVREDQHYLFEEPQFAYKLLWVAPSGYIPDNDQLEYELVISGPRSFWQGENWISIVMISIASVATLCALILTAIIIGRRCRAVMRQRRRRNEASRERVQRTSVIEALELKPFAQVQHKIANEDSACCICMEDYNGTDLVRVLNCKHHFHKECVGRWLEEHWSCPLCNQDIQSAENRYGEETGRLASPKAPLIVNPARPERGHARHGERSPPPGPPFPNSPPRRAAPIPFPNLRVSHESPSLDRGPKAQTPTTFSLPPGDPRNIDINPPLPEREERRMEGTYRPPDQGHDVENPVEMPGIARLENGRQRSSSRG